ncbi:hypothetical protein GCM10017624_05580 [Azotobacter vinelandii]|nr:hypothetical protein GCM10017624_05580 [Azotobacter vinelandii]
MLGAFGIELCLIFELEQKLQFALHAQFLIETPLDSFVQRLATAWVAAASIGPEAGPQALAGCALLQQQFTSTIEHKQ